MKTLKLVFADSSFCSETIFLPCAPGGRESRPRAQKALEQQTAVLVSGAMKLFEPSLQCSARFKFSSLFHALRVLSSLSLPLLPLELCTSSVLRLGDMQTLLGPELGYDCVLSSHDMEGRQVFLIMSLLLCIVAAVEFSTLKRLPSPDPLFSFVF